MAGFAIHLCQFFKHSKVRFGVRVNGNPSATGHLETDLLEHFTTKSEVECRGSETEVNIRISNCLALTEVRYLSVKDLLDELLEIYIISHKENENKACKLKGTLHGINICGLLRYKLNSKHVM